MYKRLMTQRTSVLHASRHPQLAGITYRHVWQQNLWLGAPLRWMPRCQSIFARAKKSTRGRNQCGNEIHVRTALLVDPVDRPTLDSSLSLCQTSSVSDATLFVLISLSVKPTWWRSETKVMARLSFSIRPRQSLAMT